MMVKAALRIEHTRHTKSPRVVLNASPLTDDPATEERPSAAGTASLGATARPALPCAASGLFAGTFPGSLLSGQVLWQALRGLECQWFAAICAWPRFKQQLAPRVRFTPADNGS